MARRLCRNLPASAIAILAGLGAMTAPIAVLGCHGRPAVGSECTRRDEIVCSAPDRALICRSNAFLELPCGGPLGCRADVGMCDTSIGAIGDTCPTGISSFACSTDRASALVCESGRFVVWRHCRGPRQCSAAEDAGVRCDMRLGELGDVCATAGAEGCSLDGGTLLRCHAGILEAASSCRGPDGCQVHKEEASVRCDDRVAIEGDPCPTPKRVACSMDGGSELSCVNGKFVTKRQCRRTACSVDKDRLLCE
ncbi:MAG: hypothetical protein ABTD50_18075 [Polyangiaceae bacterium]